MGPPPLVHLPGIFRWATIMILLILAATTTPTTATAADRSMDNKRRLQASETEGYAAMRGYIRTAAPRESFLTAFITTIFLPPSHHH